VTSADCERLGLRHQSSVVALNRRGGEHYLTPIEARRGGTTGISAADRANTLRTAATGMAADLVSPGHIVPTLVSPTGLDGGSAAPKAAVELCRWAGVAPPAALCHVLDADGGPARACEMRRLAAQFCLPWLTIDDVAETTTRLGTTLLPIHAPASFLQIIAPRM
jgi:3,4-dihydroxy 2-butanone 4-phosphate synthase/GTP cyclohydrolase II